LEPRAFAAIGVCYFLRVHSFALFTNPFHTHKKPHTLAATTWRCVIIA
jgi:hypothetical protein